jgi:LmbE family N-acetylglucosaminyl deacetylase
MAKRAIVLCPHDDDAIIGVGGTLIKLISRGWEIMYIQMTDGRHGSNVLSPKETKKIRAIESENERKALGIFKFFSFDIEDGTMAKLSENELSQTISKTAKLIEEFSPEIVFIPAEFENHPDHKTTYEIGHAAITQAKTNPIEARYVIWHIPFMQHNILPFEKLILINTSKEHARKLEVTRLHDSQEREGRYSHLVNHFNKQLGLMYTTYSDTYFDVAEIIAVTSNFDIGLEHMDVTHIFHGRSSEGIDPEAK